MMTVLGWTIAIVAQTWWLWVMTQVYTVGGNILVCSDAHERVHYPGWHTFPINTFTVIMRHSQWLKCLTRVKLSEFEHVCVKYDKNEGVFSVFSVIHKLIMKTCWPWIVKWWNNSKGINMVYVYHFYMLLQPMMSSLRGQTATNTRS